MNRHAYRTPRGAIVDKKLWSPGTLVTVTLFGGAMRDTRTLTFPERMPSGRWCVRLVDVDGLHELGRVAPRFQQALFGDEDQGTAGSEKNTSTPPAGNPSG